MERGLLRQQQDSSESDVYCLQNQEDYIDTSEIDYKPYVPPPVEENNLSDEEPQETPPAPESDPVSNDKGSSEEPKPPQKSGYSFEWLKNIIGLFAISGILLDAYYVYGSRVAYIGYINQLLYGIDDSGASSFMKDIASTPLQIVDQYLNDYFYQITWVVYLPLLSLFHIPLNVLSVYFLYVDGGSKKSALFTFMYYFTIFGELVSLIAQLVLGYYVLLSPTAIYLIRYNSVYWKYTYAALLYCSLIFLCNDGAALLLFIYMNTEATQSLGEALRLLTQGQSQQKKLREQPSRPTLV